MRVLITGGAGFIGSYVTRRLQESADEILIVDNLASGKAENVPEGVKLRQEDIRDQEALAAVFREFRPTVVCHLAAQVSTRYSYLDPVLDTSTNVLGTLNVVRECINAKVEHLVQASSMVVYGNAERQPVKETDPCRPVSQYGVSKYAAEQTALALTELAGIRFTALRLFLTYGPGQSLDNGYQGMLAIFISKVLRGEPIVIFGDGEQTRDMVHVRDVAEAFATVVAKQSTGILNVGTGHSLSINRVVDLTLAGFGHTRNSYEVTYEDPSPGDQRRIEADASRIAQVSYWHACESAPSGIKETAEWAAGRKQLSELIP